MELARRYLGPPRRGLEIGASAINAFPGLDTLNLDYPEAGLFQAVSQQTVGSVARVDLFALADALPAKVVEALSATSLK